MKELLMFPVNSKHVLFRNRQDYCPPPPFFTLGIGTARVGTVAALINKRIIQ